MTISEILKDTNYNIDLLKQYGVEVAIEKNEDDAINVIKENK